MRKLIALLAIVAAPLPMQAAAAEPVGAGRVPASSPDVTVRGPERIVCRAQTRTSTRMRTNRVCRTVREWEEARSTDSAGSYSTIEGASAKLAVIGDSCSPAPDGCE